MRGLFFFLVGHIWAFHASVTSYCDTGYTADGSWTYSGEAAAAYGIPFGSRLSVPGWGIVTVEDRGRLGPNGVDLYNPSCAEDWEWGRQGLDVGVLRWGW